MNKYGLPAKIDPDRPWALLLDENSKAIKGFPMGRGLTKADLEVWGSSPSTVWVLESELYKYLKE